MTDAIDRGCEREELDRRMAIMQRKPSGPKPTGRCAICGEHVLPGAQFCGPDCREDWELEQRRGRCR